MKGFVFPSRPLHVVSETETYVTRIGENSFFIETQGFSMIKDPTSSVDISSLPSVDIVFFCQKKIDPSVCKKIQKEHPEALFCLHRSCNYRFLDKANTLFLEEGKSCRISPFITMEDVGGYLLCMPKMRLYFSSGTTPSKTIQADLAFLTSLEEEKQVIAKSSLFAVNDEYRFYMDLLEAKRSFHQLLVPKIGTRYPC